MTAEIEAALAELTLEEKVLLLTGRDFWSTSPIERIGLRSMTMSDGPSGVRGPVWDERHPSLNLPSASALSASWDREVARRYGALAAVEARRKGIDIVLGPTINLHRSPRGGRHFEAFSEDPVLTSELAAEYVTGMQNNGVGATLKHYVANDSETERFTADNRVDERALRELYLLAFEKAVVESRAWLVMSAYNSVNGTTLTENDLLEHPLNSEWGFDGVVVSDWTAVRSLASAAASQDLEMPGPVGAWGDALVEAVRDGRVPEDAIDRKVRRLLTLATRVGALGEHRPAELTDVEDGPAFVREAAAEGLVLLENRGELPWTAAALSRVAVIGDSAEHARTQGGGSATVVPTHIVSPLEGIIAALPSTQVDFARGAVSQVGLASVPREMLGNPVTGAAGAQLTFRAADGTVLLAEDRYATELVWFGGDAPLREASEIELEFILTPTATELVEFGFAASGRGRLWIDGELMIDETLVSDVEDLGAAFLNPPSRTAEVPLVAGVPLRVRFVYDASAVQHNALSVTVGTRPSDRDSDRLIAEAVETARTAEVVVVVVGTNAAVESEGIDRTSLALPGRQDELVRAVAAVNPRTVVLINAGAPVLMPWRDDVAAVLVGWFGGQEFGNAVADVLLGVREPGGRLPTTWPSAEEDVPVLDTSPVDGVLEYSEGIHIGYRAWLRSPSAPAYWFGHGLGYADIRPTAVSVDDGPIDGEALEVRVTVANHSDRAGKQVIQVYAERAESNVERPQRWLVGFEAVRVAASSTDEVSIVVPRRLLAHWSHGWQLEPGEYTLRVGTSAAALPLASVVRL